MLPSRTRGRPKMQITKSKLPSPSRNKSKLSKSQQQTIYESSDQQNSINKHFNQQWTQQKLQVNYKPDKIVGRDNEKHCINEFISGCLMKEITNRCLYISGCPGLGKTVTVMQIIEQISKDIDPKKALFQYINCLSLKRPASIYKQLLLKSKTNLQSKRKQPFQLAIEFDKFVRSSKIQYFFVIDEVDFLYTKNQNVLYNIVEWCSQAQCKFSILLIANTIDFPQKLAPKINSRMGSWRMCFKPYSSQEIKKILQQRLQGCEYFQTKAIQFAVKKFAVYTSDLRKIFNILKQVIHNHSHNKKKKITIQQLSTVWNRLVETQNLQWKEELPEIYKTIIDLLKRQGGKVHSYQLFDLLSQKKVLSQQVQMVLIDLRDMGVVKLVQKDYKGVKGLMATLLDINV